MAISTISLNGKEAGWGISATSSDLTTAGLLISAAAGKSITLRQLNIIQSATSVIRYSLSSKESASASLVNILEGMLVTGSSVIPSASPVDFTFINSIKWPQGHAMHISANAKALTHVFAAGDFI